MIELASRPVWQHPASRRASVERSRLVPYAATRSRSIRRRNDAIWFQLANVRVTSLRSRLQRRRELRLWSSLSPASSWRYGVPSPTLTF